MNKKIVFCFFFSLIQLVLISCNSETENYVLEAPEDQMKLRVSSKEIVLNGMNEDEIAVTFSWDNAKDRGQGTKLVYLFRMRMAEQINNSTKIYEIPLNEKSISFTFKELHDMLAGWNILDDTKVTIEAEVIADVIISEVYMKPEVSFVLFDILNTIE